MANSAIACDARPARGSQRTGSMSRWPAFLAVAALSTGCVSRHGRLHPAWASIALAAEIISDIHHAKMEERAVEAAEAQAAQPPPPPPRDLEVGVPQWPPTGFYCARSTSAGDISLCTRDRESCREARNAATLGVPDLAPCTAAGTAWCFAGRCYANEASCERRRGPDSIGYCEEIE